MAGTGLLRNQDKREEKTALEDIRSDSFLYEVISGRFIIYVQLQKSRPFSTARDIKRTEKRYSSKMATYTKTLKGQASVSNT